MSKDATVEIIDQKYLEATARRHAAYKNKLAKSKEYNKALRDKRREQGLCVRCGAVAASPKLHCNACLEYRHKEYVAHVDHEVKPWRGAFIGPKLPIYERRKRNGICTHCGKEPADKESLLCWQCRLWNRQQKSGYVEHSYRYKGRMKKALKQSGKET